VDEAGAGDGEQQIIDELTRRLIDAAEALHVRDIDSIAAYQGAAIAVSDMMRELDQRLRDGEPWPSRWKANRA
jgi:hypothetical protein